MRALQGEPIMSAFADIRKAGFRDTQAKIKAIRLALGKAEGRATKKGHPKPISQEEFAARVGCAVSAVKKWESYKADHQEPERDSLIELNKVAPPELRFSINGGGGATPQSQGSELPSPLQVQAMRWFPRKPDGQPFTEDEWREFVVSIARLAKP